MTRRSVLAFTVALALAGCNKPSPEPSATVPDAGTADTVAAAGAPVADSTAMAADTTLAVPADTTADTLKTN